MSKQYRNYSKSGTIEAPKTIEAIDITDKTDKEVEELLYSGVEKTESEETVKPDLLGIVVDCSNLNVRADGDTTAPVITTIKAGINVRILDETVDWYKVNVNGVTGFCMKRFIKLR